MSINVQDKDNAMIRFNKTNDEWKVIILQKVGFVKSRPLYVRISYVLSTIKFF